MKTSDLIKILQDSILKHGDLDVKIESSFGEYEERNIVFAGPVRQWLKGDKFPNYTGMPYFLMSNDKEDKVLRDIMRDGLK